MKITALPSNVLFNIATFIGIEDMNGCQLMLKSMGYDIEGKQLLAVHNIMMKKNLFITGPAGSGKSYLIHIIKKLLPKATITAMTGAAAALIGGSTLHSVLGIGCEKSAPSMYRRIKKFNRDTIWKLIETLVIDEVSMMSIEIFEAIDIIAQDLRQNNMPFGGIQIILFGDFCQLPPIKSETFIFESYLWEKINIIKLDKIFRQTDERFVRLLNNARTGNLTNEDIELLNTRIGAEIGTALIKPTKLYSLNKNVDYINNSELEKLPNKKIYKANMKTNIINRDTGYFKKLCEIIGETGTGNIIKLAIGAQVMLKINLNVETGLCNGSRGVVVGFEKKLPKVEFMNGSQVVIVPYKWRLEDGDAFITKKQIPLKLAYAITIHSAQGATLDCVETDLGKSIFTDGQAYTALSRVKNLESLKISNLMPLKFHCNPKVFEFEMGI